MKPVPVPTDPSRESWERLAQDRMLRAIHAGDALSPNDVAPRIFAAMEAEFAARFPGQDFPLPRIDATASRHNGEPANVAELTADHPERMVWSVASMARDANGVTLMDDVTQAELASIAATYDPTWRPAPVILPDGGPSHFTGETSRFIPAKVLAAQYDGYFLWLLSEERYPGSMQWPAAEQRSISWWPSLPEVPGADIEAPPSYLVHYALLTGEQPAIPNMLPLDTFFAHESGLGPERTAALKSVPMRSLSVSVHPTEDAAMPEPKNTVQPDPAKATDQADGIVRRFLAAMKDALEPTPEPATEPKPDPVVEPAKAPTLDAKSLAAAFTAGIKPVLDELAAVRTELAASKDAAAKRSASARRELVGQALDGLVRARKLSPPMRSIVLAQLTADAVTDEAVTKALTELAALPATALPTTSIPIPTADGADVQYIEPPRHISLPAELGYAVKPEGLALEARAREAAAAETDDAKRRDVYCATIMAGLDGGRHAAARLPFRVN